AHMRRVSGGGRGVAAWRQLPQRLDELGAQKLYLVGDPAENFPRALFAYLVHPRPTVNGWRGSWLEAAAAADVEPVLGAGVLPVMWGTPPFAEPCERLPGGLSVLDPGRPLIFKVDNPNWGVERHPGGRYLTWLGATPVKLHVWAPRPMTATLSWDGFAGDSASADKCCHLRVRSPDAAVTE